MTQRPLRRRPPTLRMPAHAGAAVHLCRRRAAHKAEELCPFTSLRKLGHGPRSRDLDDNEIDVEQDISSTRSIPCTFARGDECSESIHRGPQGSYQPCYVLLASTGFSLQMLAIGCSAPYVPERTLPFNACNCQLHFLHFLQPTQNDLYLPLLLALSDAHAVETAHARVPSLVGHERRRRGCDHVVRRLTRCCTEAVIDTMHALLSPASLDETSVTLSDASSPSSRLVSAAQLQAHPWPGDAGRCAARR